MRDETKNRKPIKDIDNVQVKHSFPPDETVQPTDIEQTENNMTLNVTTRWKLVLYS